LHTIITAALRQNQEFTVIKYHNSNNKAYALVQQFSNKTQRQNIWFTAITQHYSSTKTEPMVQGNYLPLQLH